MEKKVWCGRRDWCAAPDWRLEAGLLPDEFDDAGDWGDWLPPVVARELREAWREE